ncbi:hypothetical protein F4553_001997 [Allocatelliglobosispora scoriae]|uniref:Fibronectin type-III domain-containing protein n=1 Tax=Allocatelliglobosispora scoriae TaxID=643052 RepID=A0A841BML3_9ACTN|nr:fibronectin type III domain-containing protein [Allocatelliglobosispora scoriae]MBB5868618.1 hypothetical protein [Allocatelliglobosispora scoriae]
MRTLFRKLRNPRTLWALCLAALVAVPLLFANGSPTERLDFSQAGHWVYNEVDKAIFHIHGGSKKADARIRISGVEQGGLIVQGDANGYMVDNGQAIVFGKSDLRVSTTVQVPTGEQPLGLEAPAGPFLVYKQLGTLVQLGVPPTTIQIGSPVRSAVATRDGVIWVQRADSDVLCSLDRAARSFRCDEKNRGTSRGSLVSVGRQAGFIDPTQGTLTVIGEQGIGKPVTVMRPLSGGGQVAATDGAGRLAVLDSAGSRLILADTSWVERGTSQSPASPVEVALKAGQYAPPVATDGSVALLDKTRSQLLTFQGNGESKSTVKVPAPADSARLTRGGDGRVYVDDSRGEHTLVVDTDGKVTSVNASGDMAGSTPSASASPSPSLKPSPAPNLKPANPPGAPRALTARPGNASVVLSWQSALANGAAITEYQITWPGGSASVRGNRRTETVDGLANGTAYTFQIVAVNRAGRGQAATSVPVTPSSEVPSPPARVTATANGDGTVTANWPAANGEGHTIIGYTVTAGGSDGGSASFNTTGGTTATMGTGDGLTLGITYTFSVVATNELGLSSRSSGQSNGVAPYGPAAAPPGLRATGTDATVDLIWGEPDLRGGDLVHYLVSGSGLPDQTISGTTARYAGLTNGQSHTFTVHAVTRGRAGGGQVNGADASANAAPGIPPSVVLDSARANGDRQGTMHVTVNDHNSGPVTCQVIMNGAERWRGGCGTQDITIGGLEYATDYQVQVQVGNAYGYGSISGFQSFRTNNPPPPPPSVSVSRGARHNVTGCAGAACANVNVNARNLPANTRFDVTCVSGKAGDSGPYWTVQRTTDGNGNFDIVNGSDFCIFGYTGSDVWVTVGPYESNHYRW